jgi:hypothetical protein
MDPAKAAKFELDVQPGISAVLAAHDDSTELAGAVLDLAAVLDGLVGDNFEIIVARVGCPGGAATDHLAGLRAGHPDLPLRLLEGDHSGEVLAWVAGFEAATYDLILVTTADGQFEVRESNHLMDAVDGGADVAIGYRVHRTDGFVRRMQARGWNMLVRLLFGKIGRDVDCPFRLFRRAAWLKMAMHPRNEPTPIFNAEFLVRARRLNFQVAEVPLSHPHARSAELGRAASPAEVGRAFVELLELRRSLNVRLAANDGTAGRRVPSGRQVA